MKLDHLTKAASGWSTLQPLKTQQTLGWKKLPGASMCAEEFGFLRCFVSCSNSVLGGPYCFGFLRPLLCNWFQGHLLEKDVETCRGETGVAVIKDPALWPCSLDRIGNNSDTAIVSLQEIKLWGGGGGQERTCTVNMYNTLALGKRRTRRTSAL